MPEVPSYCKTVLIGAFPAMPGKDGWVTSSQLASPSMSTNTEGITQEGDSKITCAIKYGTSLADA
uniref:Uncharacterized protein n=1 Tax=Salix viminalis TaxID=40686 RepID=A0A6N2LGM7_SALVM